MKIVISSDGSKVEVYDVDNGELKVSASKYTVPDTTAYLVLAVRGPWGSGANVVFDYVKVYSITSRAEMTSEDSGNNNSNKSQSPPNFPHFLLLQAYKTGGAITSVAVSGDGKYIVAGSEDGYAYLFDRTGSLLWKFNASGEVYSVDISKDRNYIVVGGKYKSYLLNRNGNVLWDKDYGSHHVEISDDGRTVLIDYRIFARNGNFLAEIHKSFTPSYCTISPEGNYIACINLWDHGTEGLEVATREGHRVFYYIDDAHYSTSLSEYARYVFSSYYYWNYWICLRDKQGSLLWKYNTEDNVLTLDISYDGSYAVAGDVLGNIYTFIRNGTLIWRYKANDRISEIKITPDGEYTLAGSWDKHLYLFFTPSGSLLWGGALDGAVTSVDISDDAKTIVAGTDTGYVYIYLPSAEAVQGKIIRLENTIKEYSSMGINMTAVKVILQKAEELYKKGSYNEANKNVDLAYQKAAELKKQYDQAMSRCKNAIDAYQNAAKLVTSLKRKGINVSKALELLNSANKSYSQIITYARQGEYDKISNTLVQELYTLSTNAMEIAKMTERNYYNATTEIDKARKKVTELRSQGIIIPKDIESTINSSITLFSKGKYVEASASASKAYSDLLKLDKSYQKASPAYHKISSSYSEVMRLLDSLRLENISLASLKNVIEQTNRSIATIETLFNSGDYDRVLYMANDTLKLINLLKNDAVNLKKQYFVAKSSLENATLLMNSFRNEGISIQEAEKFINQAEKLFNEGKYREAYEFSKKGIELYIKSTQGVIEEADAFLKHFSGSGDTLKQAKNYFKKGDYATAYVLALKAKNANSSMKKKIYIGLGFIGLLFIIMLVRGGGSETFEETYDSTDTSQQTEPESVTPPKPQSSTYSEYSQFPVELTHKYEVLEYIGEGGFGRVFMVRRKKDKKIVAIKVPFAKRGMGKVFLKEIATWSHLNHKNIVKLYDADIEPIPHIEMEYVEGVNLNGEIIRDLGSLPKPLPEDIALELVKEIAEGLNHAHSKGIYHLDLKPLNVLLKSDLTPKITDWGLARISARSSFTNIRGYTPLYTAPELIDENKYGSPDHRTDIYQLGLIFYELLTGELPYTAYTPEALTEKIVSRDVKPKPPSQLNEKLAKYDSFFEKALAKPKERRFQSIEEFISALTWIDSLKREFEKTKKELEATKSTMSRTRSKKELRRLKREAIKKTIRVAILSAKLNDKIELLKALDDLSIYTRNYRNELRNAIEQVRLMKKENIPITPDFVDELELLFYKIEREF